MLEILEPPATSESRLNEPLDVIEQLAHQTCTFVSVLHLLLLHSLKGPRNSFIKGQNIQ